MEYWQKQAKYWLLDKRGIKMTDLNNVTLIGRLAKDAATKEVGSTTLTSLLIAVNSSYKKNEEWLNEVSYFDVNAWKLSEKLCALLVKGKAIAITGTLKQERWEKDGQKYSRVVINSNSIQLLGGNDNSEPSNFTKKANVNNEPQDADFGELPPF